MASPRGDAFAALSRLLKGPFPKTLGLGDHLLDQHYTSRVVTRRMPHLPARQLHARLPNRYYSFRHAGIDVFPLRSNTFKPTLLPDGPVGGPKGQIGCRTG